MKQFTAVITPQAAILAVGAAEPEPVATPTAGVAVHQVLRLTLSIDHRALDGATGARFLAQLKEVLEHPADRRLTGLLRTSWPGWDSTGIVPRRPAW